MEEPLLSLKNPYTKSFRFEEEGIVFGFESGMVEVQVSF